MIDSGPATDPTTDPSATVEALLTDIAPYLTRPNGLSTANMSAEPGLESAEIVATRLLYFEATNGANEITMDLRATSLDGLGREVNIGAVSLLDHRRTSQYLRSFFPRN